MYSFPFTVPFRLGCVQALLFTPEAELMNPAALLLSRRGILRLEPVPLSRESVSVGVLDLRQFDPVLGVARFQLRGFLEQGFFLQGICGQPRLLVNRFSP